MKTLRHVDIQGGEFDSRCKDNEYDCKDDE